MLYSNRMIAVMSATYIAGMSCTCIVEETQNTILTQSPSPIPEAGSRACISRHDLPRPRSKPQDWLPLAMTTLHVDARQAMGMAPTHCTTRAASSVSPSTDTAAVHLPRLPLLSAMQQYYYYYCTPVSSPNRHPMPLHAPTTPGLAASKPCP